jgi:hypothetical protein
LRLDEGLIRDAKRAASARGVSLSEMVSGYFQAVCKGETVKIEATPVLAEICGVLRVNLPINTGNCRRSAWGEVYRKA